MKRPPKSDPSAERKPKAPVAWIDFALRKLARRDFAEGEMYRALVDAESGEPEAARVVQQLKAMGYLNDEKLLQAQARSCRARRRGPGYLWQRLMRRGFELSRVEVARLYNDAAEPTGFGEAVGDDESTLVEQESARAWETVGRREPDVRKARQKVMARLIRRGFTPDLVFMVCAKLGK